MSNETQVPYVWTQGGLAMCLKGRPYNFAKEDTLFPDLVSALRDHKSEDEILALIETPVESFKQAIRLTPDVHIEDGIVFFKNEAMHMSLADRMLQMLEEGYDLVPMAKFLENLMANPSHAAVKELYSFLEKGKMPITPDGYFMAYKAVGINFKDIHSGTYDNSIGCVCEMPRNKVDDDRNRTCSSGLHFCSFEYLPHFAHANGHVMLVKINPCDVVSIPADYNDTKGRCSRYEVVAEYEGYYKKFGPAFDSMLYDPENATTNCGNCKNCNCDDEVSSEYRLIGLYTKDADYEDGEDVGEYDDLTEAKHDAVEYISDYAKIVVLDEYDNEVFSIQGR